MSRALAGAALLLAATCGAAQADSWLYRVELDPAAPQTARVVVELPAQRRAEDFSVQARGRSFGLMPQISEPRCDGAPLAPDSAGAWRVQGWNCVRLSWTVTVPAAAGGFDPRLRESRYSAAPAFWLVNEATVLLRPVGDPAHAGEIEFVGGGPVHGGVPARKSARRVLPARGEPPEFYVVGALPATVVREDGLEVTHVDALDAAIDELLAQQRPLLRYLLQAAAMKPALQMHCTVAWLAAAPETEPIALAGPRTVLLADAVRDGRPQHGELVLASLQREQFLQIAPAAMPLWVRESLAQYYAIKALRRSDMPGEAVAAVERRYIDLLHPPPILLREAQRRLQAGEFVRRGDLHTVGATFWDRLDKAIVRKSGFRTLDSALPRLLAATWVDDRLPPAILERLYRYAGQGAVDDLVAQYVGE